MQSAERSSAEVDVDVGDGLALHIARKGTGPPVVLLHGFTGAIDTWSSLVDSLCSDYEAISIDLPGHGRSTSPADPARYSLDRFSDDLARVLDSLQLRRVAVLGYSMGGRAALQFAVAHGDRVAALILESTSPGITDDSARDERLSADSALAAMIDRDGVAAFVERWERLPLWETQQRLAASQREQLRGQRLANHPAGLANSLRGAGAGASQPVTAQLHEIVAPALIIAGALDDKYVGLAGVLAERLPNADLRIVSQAGHAVHFENPEAFGAIVHEWLDNIPSTNQAWAASR